MKILEQFRELVSEISEQVMIHKKKVFFKNDEK